MAMESLKAVVVDGLWLGSLENSVIHPVVHMFAMQFSHLIP